MTVTRTNYSTGSHFEERNGYCRAVRVGDMLYVSGTVGLDYDTGTIPDDPAAQVEQIVKNLELAVTGAGAAMADIVQVIVYVTGPEVFEAIVPTLSRVFGPIGPTNTALTVAFPFEGIKVEISATAIVGCGKNVELLRLR